MVRISCIALCLFALLFVHASTLRYSSRRDGQEERRDGIEERRDGKEEAMDGKEEIMDGKEGKEEIGDGEEENKENKDADGELDATSDLRSLMMRRKMQLMNLQMLVASAWLEEDSFSDAPNDDKWWLGDNSTNHAMHQYREFERGATARMGGAASNNFWSLGMNNFLQYWKGRDAPAEDDPKRHIVVRRKIGAMMLLEEEEERDGWVEDQISKYATLYMSELIKRKAVMLSHISKSGGTDLAECGFEAGCQAPSKEDLQAHIASTGSSSSTKLVTKSNMVSENCQQTVDFNEEHHVTLMDNQNHLSDVGLCHQFWNVIVLRDPIDRLVSQLNYLHTHVVSKEWAPEYLNPEWLFNEIPILTNNFFVRNLIGSKGYELPYGKITKDHLEEAKRALEGYDVVLLKTKTLKEDMYSYLGWDCDHAPGAESSGRAEAYAKKMNEIWSPEHWQALKEANFLDFQLYQHARMLEKIDKKVYNHPMFSYYANYLQYDACKGDTFKCGFLCK